MIRQGITAVMSDRAIPLGEDRPMAENFREIRDKIELLNDQLESNEIGTRTYDTARTDLDIECGQLVSGKEDLLDAATEMLLILEAIMSDRDGLDRLQAFTMDGEFFDPREVISAVIAKAKGGT